MCRRPLGPERPDGSPVAGGADEANAAGDRKADANPRPGPVATPPGWPAGRWTGGCQHEASSPHPRGAERPAHPDVEHLQELRLRPRIRGHSTRRACRAWASATALSTSTRAR